MSKVVNTWALVLGFGTLWVACKNREPIPKPPLNTQSKPAPVPVATTHGTPENAAATKIAPVGAARSQSAPGLCPSLCTHTLIHACGSEMAECLTGCEQMLSMPVCQHEVKTAYGCMAAQPSENFECHEGIAVIKDGHCDAEQGAFAGCLQRLQTRR